MKSFQIIFGMALLATLISGCETTTTPPDISSLQPSRQEQNQEKIQQSLQW